MRDRAIPRYIKWVSTLSLRQRAGALAITFVVCAVDDTFVASNAVRRLSMGGVALCVGVASAIAVADYAFRARKRIANLPSDPAQLAQGSRETYAGSRNLIWFVAGLTVFWQAVHLPARVDSALNLSMLSFCAVGFALASFGFWRAGTGRYKDAWAQAE